MSTRRKFIKVVLVCLAGLAGLALLAASPLILLVIMDPFGAAAHPNDAALLKQFAAQRPTLEALVAMAEQDEELVRVAADFTRPENPGVPAERLALYRQRLADAGIAHGLTRSGDAIFFIVSTRGLSIGGSAKGIVFQKKADPDAVVVEGDLDAAATIAVDKDILLQRRIDADWWLALDMR